MGTLNQNILFVFIVLGALFCQSCQEENATNKPVVSKGIIDLKEWNFEKDGIVKLNGDWEFYWNRFLMDTLSVDIDKNSFGYMNVPGLWNNKIIDGIRLFGHGYSSYRLVLKLPLNEEFAIKYLNSATSCELFIDGVSIYSAGEPDKTSELIQPSYHPSIITFTPKSENVELVLQIANFHHKKGGQWEPLIIGKKNQITQLRESKVFIELLLIGSIFIIGLFHLLISTKNTNEKSMFYFGVFAILIATKLLVSGEFTIYLISNPNWFNIVRIDYLSFYLSILFFLFFLRSLYPSETSKLVSTIVISSSLLFSASVLILPVNYFTYGIIYFEGFIIFGGIYAFYVLIMANKKKREGASYFLYAFIALFICMVFDILNENEIIYSISLVPIGLTVFILVQALILSSRIRNALTSNKKLSDELAQQNTEYATLNKKYKVQNKSLKLAKEKAEESDRFKSAFLANISHEIRTPMNGILGFTGLLNNKDLPEEKRIRYLSILKERGHHLLGVINDIIDVSKIETGQIEIHSEPTSINELIKDLFNNYSPLTDLKNLKLRKNKSLKGYESVVLTDKQKLKQILDNLLSNAIKFTQNGEIEFGYILKDNFLHFYIRDTGIGISENEVEIIFERFNQANKSISQKFGGTGLGLSIVKAYVNKLGGQIWVDSMKGVGSTFKFTIPYYPQLTSLQGEIETSENIVNKKGLTLLLVEDNMTNAYLITEILETMDIEILQASNGREAIKLFKKNQWINLVLLDIKLPDINGYDLIKELKLIRDNVPFIAQTAYALKGDKEKALEAGFNDYITKPINSKELIRKIIQHTALV